MLNTHRWWGHKLFSRLGNLSQKLGVSYGVSIATDDATKANKLGLTAVYTITVTNNGSAPDTFDIAKSGEVWTTVLSDASIGPIAAEGLDTFTVTVTVPYGELVDATDAVTVAVTSQANPLVSDNVALTSTAEFWTDALELWLRADKISGLEDNDPIAQWNDESGNTRHATQATGAKKPIYKVNAQNGLPAVDFDGATHYMSLDMSGGAIAAADHTVIIAYKGRASASEGDQRILHRLLVAAHYIPAAAVTATVGKIGYYSGAWISPANAIDGVQVVTWQLDDAGAEIFRDGVSIAAGQAHTNLTFEAVATLGADSNGDYTFNGQLLEVVFYGSMLSDADRAALETYLLGKWAI